jgi:TPR repeat protein
VRLADYPKINAIGKGAFGELYSARDPRTGGLVAVKVMRNDLTSEQERRMFVREVEILASVDHHTLLGFRGWVPLDGSDPPAILTELMTKGSLQGMINAEVKHTAPAEWDDTRKFIALYGTAIGMMVLHKNRIIHRDLKPDNILLNDQYEPKVADFGLSKLVEQGATMMQTMQGGTVPFMAPEIYEGQEYAFPVDVYAYAMLVYHAVTYMVPFQGVTSAYAIGQKVCKGERPPIPNWVGANWRELITACWNGVAEQRPTFEQVVMGMGSADFLDASVDKRAVLAYQQRTLPLEFHLQGSLSGPAVATRAKTPLERIKDSADAGDGPAAYAYACTLRDGEAGMQPDLVQAAAYFYRAATAGDVQGMIELGLANEMARGVPQNYSEACRWYRAATERGSAHAAYCYADMFECGKGVPKNPPEAVRLYKQAADAGHERAQAKYGLICEQGSLGIQKNLPEAVRYYKMSSDQGNARGMFYYADMLEFGKGVAKNMPEAVKLYRLAAQKGYAPAIGYLGWLLVEGDGVQKDVDSGVRLLLAAADEGDVQSMIKLGGLLEKQGSLDKAFTFYKMAAETGAVRGVFHYARCLDDGIGVRADPAQAATLYQKLVDQANDCNAMYCLAILKLQGKGVRKDIDAGVKLLKRAIAEGHQGARRLLEQLTK